MDPADSDARAFWALQHIWTEKSQGRKIPGWPDLNDAQRAQLGQLLEPMELPIEEAARQKVDAHFARLANHAVGKPLDDPAVWSEERALVLEIIDATKIPVETAKSARLKRVAAIKALVGETFWASLTPHPRHFSTTRAN